MGALLSPRVSWEWREAEKGGPGSQEGHFLVLPGLSERPGAGPSGRAPPLLGVPGTDLDTSEPSRLWGSLELWRGLGRPPWAPRLAEVPGEDRRLALPSCFLLPPGAEAQAESGERPPALSPGPARPRAKGSLIPDPLLARACLLPCPLTSACGSLFLRDEGLMVGGLRPPCWVVPLQVMTLLTLLGQPGCSSPLSLDSSWDPALAEESGRGPVGPWVPGFRQL